MVDKWTAMADQNTGKTPNSKKVIVLRVYIHCLGCENEVIKCLRGFQGVEEIEVDAKGNRVTIKGEEADPINVVERLRKKTGKHVELISPLPKKEKEKEEQKAPEEPNVVEVVLKIYMHCQGCTKEVKHCIHKMEGVQTVEVDMENNVARVKGTMDPQKLVEFIWKRSSRHAAIVSKNDVKQKNEHESNGKKNNKRKKENKEEHLCYEYPSTHGMCMAPQLFSDENPNSCVVM